MFLSHCDSTGTDCGCVYVCVFVKHAGTAEEGQPRISDGNREKRKGITF